MNYNFNDITMYLDDINSYVKSILLYHSCSDNVSLDYLIGLSNTKNHMNIREEINKDITKVRLLEIRKK